MRWPGNWNNQFIDPIMQRRTLLKLLGVGAVVGTGVALWPDEGLLNPCLQGGLPPKLLSHELVQAAWEGIDSRYYLDSHVHIVGTGDTASGIWLHPDMRNPLKFADYVRFRFYMNAACIEPDGNVDGQYVNHLLHLHGDFPVGAKFMMLAFDYYHNEKGERLEDKSRFAVPNEYASRLVKQYPGQFEWAASIHPYRQDAVERLDWSVQQGARVLKWLPQVMGIDPASPLCEPFYEALVKHDIPLLTHAGDEHAVAGVAVQRLGNPLLLRKPLEHGVKVIVAHCATMGTNHDIDRRTGGKEVRNYELFARLMNESRYEGQLFGDLSSITQVNRDGPALINLITRREWHPRLLNGSDFPLPGVMPLFSVKRLAGMGLLDTNQIATLKALRRYNPILFDFVLKRSMRYKGMRLSDSIFETGRLLYKPAPA